MIDRLHTSACVESIGVCVYFFGTHFGELANRRVY